jgi:hypothetical protein
LTLGVRDTTTGYDQLTNIVFSVESVRHENILHDETISFGLIHLAEPKWTIL